MRGGYSVRDSLERDTYNMELLMPAGDSVLVLLKAVVRTLPAKKVKARLAAIFYAFS